MPEMLDYFPRKSYSVVMRHPLIIATAVLLAGYTATIAFADLPRSAPEEQGIPSEAMIQFVSRADRELDSLHSLMILRNGKVVAEGWWTPYEAGARHELYSLSKSFASTAIGLAAAEGRLSVDDPVVKFFPEDLPESPSENLKAMRIRDLLCMSTGHEKEISAAAATVSAKAFLAHAVPFKPGTHFLYNTPATFMLSAIVQKVTGSPLLEYLRPRLFEPLGIEHATWDTNFEGISLGGYGLSVRTEDIASFGQLYLQKGAWQGKELLPAHWVEMASTKQTSNGSNPNSDWDQGYGFQFWRCRNNAYRGDGAFGQFCVVMPEQNAVIAITSGLGDMQKVLNIIWEELLPAFASETLPANPASHRKLQHKLAALKLRGVTGSKTTPIADRVIGKKVELETNSEGFTGVTVDENSLILHTSERDQRIKFAQDEWVRGRASIGGQPERPIATTGAWSTPEIFTAKICFTETPYILTCTVKFEDNRVFLDREFNVFFGPRRLPRLAGKLE